MGADDDDADDKKLRRDHGGSSSLNLALVVVGGLAVLALLQRAQLTASPSSSSSASAFGTGWSTIANATGLGSSPVTTTAVLDEAIAKRRQSIDAIEAQTAALKEEQKAMLARTKALARRAESTLEELQRRPPPPVTKEVPAAPAVVPQQQQQQQREAARAAPASDLASAEEARGGALLRGGGSRGGRGGAGGSGGGKRKLVRFYSRAGTCHLAVYARGGGDSEWLRCDDGAPTIETIFELTPSGHSAGAVWLRALGNDKYVEVVPPGEELAWVVRASLAAPPRDASRVRFFVLTCSEEMPKPLW